jgi:hypothetical protein
MLTANGRMLALLNKLEWAACKETTETKNKGMRMFHYYLSLRTFEYAYIYVIVVLFMLHGLSEVFSSVLGQTLIWIKKGKFYPITHHEGTGGV